MTILKRAWKATEVDREGLKGFLNGGMVGEARFAFRGLLVLFVLPLFVVACLVLAVLSLFR